LEKAAEAARLTEERRRDETEAWAKVAATTEISEFEAFLKAWPYGNHVATAKGRVRELLRLSNKEQGLHLSFPALLIALGIISFGLGLVFASLVGH
jgi:hypothetical protein